MYSKLIVFKSSFQVQTWISQGQKQLMCTGRPGWQTMSFRQPLYKKTHFNVHIDLVDVLEIDKSKMVILFSCYSDGFPYLPNQISSQLQTEHICELKNNM